MSSSERVLACQLPVLLSIPFYDPVTLNESFPGLQVEPPMRTRDMRDSML